MKPSALMSLDDLPSGRLADALALLHFLRQHPIEWFVVGSQSAEVAQDLADCGYLRLVPDRDGTVSLLRVAAREVQS